MRIIVKEKTRKISIEIGDVVKSRDQYYIITETYHEEDGCFLYNAHCLDDGCAWCEGRKTISQLEQELREANIEEPLKIYKGQSIIMTIETE